jgi:hypothetical protein
VEISLRAYLLAAVALFMLNLGQKILDGEGKFLIECLRAQTSSTKTSVLAIFF